MALPLLILLAAIIVVTSAVWASSTVFGRVKYQPCGYRMIRHRRPATTLTHGFGIGVTGGLGIVVLGVALLV